MFLERLGVGGKLYTGWGDQNVTILQLHCLSLIRPCGKEAQKTRQMDVLLS